MWIDTTCAECILTQYGELERNTLIVLSRDRKPKKLKLRENTLSIIYICCHIRSFIDERNSWYCQLFIKEFSIRSKLWRTKYEPLKIPILQAISQTQRFFTSEFRSSIHTYQSHCRAAAYWYSVAWGAFRVILLVIFCRHQKWWLSVGEKKKQKNVSFFVFLLYFNWFGELAYFSLWRHRFGISTEYTTLAAKFPIYWKNPQKPPFFVTSNADFGRFDWVDGSCSNIYQYATA